MKLEFLTPTALAVKLDEEIFAGLECKRVMRPIPGTRRVFVTVLNDFITSILMRRCVECPYFDGASVDGGNIVLEFSSTSV